MSVEAMIGKLILALRKSNVPVKDSETSTLLFSSEESTQYTVDQFNQATETESEIKEFGVQCEAIPVSRHTQTDTFYVPRKRAMDLSSEDLFE